MAATAGTLSFGHFNKDYFIFLPRNEKFYVGSGISLKMLKLALCEIIQSSFLT
jgi:hypothetical protein